MRNTLVVIVTALIITGLFHKQALGLNLLISEIILLTWILFSKQLQLNKLYHVTLGFGLIISSIFTVITHSVFSYIINFLVLFILIGLLIYPETKSLIISLGQAFANIFHSQVQFFKELSGSKLKGQKLSSYIWKFRIFVIPIIIIILFIIIYRNSNPVFDKLVINTGAFFQEKLSFLFKDFDFLIIVTFLISLFISIFIFIRISNQWLVGIDLNSSEELKEQRNKKQKNFRIEAIKNEHKAGIFLLVVLNLLILILNIIDIKWVWFGFEWECQYLKQFVHEGTYLLILSIIISIILVLYFFRGNLNFFDNNKYLKYLSYLWLAQNGILSVSVAIRNFWYIKYFALAYKRIGVIIFLILTIYGLYTVYVKVKKRKSAFFLFKTNFYVLLLILITSSIINWDNIIAKYNFKNSYKSFLHLDYLSTLSDKALPYLDKSFSELKQVDLLQKEKFPFEQKFMSPEEYYQVIENRKRDFKEKWESKSVLSWNFADYLAYKKLNKDSYTNP